MSRAGVDKVGLHAFRPWTPPARKDSPAEVVKPARGSKVSNVVPSELVNRLHREAVAQRAQTNDHSAARKLVRQACAALGRSEEEASYWADRLEAEWLEDLSQLRSMSEEDWNGLEMPMALRSALCRYLGSHPPNPAAAAARGVRPSSAPARRYPSRSDARRAAAGGRAYAQDSLWGVIQGQAHPEEASGNKAMGAAGRVRAVAVKSPAGNTLSSASSSGSAKKVAQQAMPSEKRHDEKARKQPNELEAWRDLPMGSMMQEAREHAAVEAQLRRLPKTEVLVERLRSALRRRGGDPLLAVARALRVHTARRSDGTVSGEELQAALRQVGVGISGEDLASLSAMMDRSTPGPIDVEAWLSLMRGPLSSPRAALVREVFRQLDTDRDGLLSIRELQECFIPKRHPDVEAGRKNKREVEFELLVALGELDADRDGRLTLYEFLRYYEGFSAGISNDQFFAHVVRSTWGLDPGPHGQNARNKRRAFEGNIRITESGLSG